MLPFSSFSEEKLRKKWKYLRDQFKNELSKQKRPRSGDAGGEISKSKWQFFEHLLFLKDIVQCRQSSGNLSQPVTQYSESVLSTSETQELFEEPMQAAEEERIIESNEDVENTDVPPTPYHPTQGSSRKRAKPDDFNKSILHLEKRKVDLLATKVQNRNSSDENEHILFFKSLLPHVKKICPERILEFRTSVQQIVQQYAYNQPIASQSPSSYTSTPYSFITLNEECVNQLAQTFENVNENEK